jgi:dTDP-4-amino-4,6-dideoxygalactose transaminase
MNIPYVDLGLQYQNLKCEIDAAIADVIAETAFVGNAQNRFVAQFEEAFARYAGSEHCIACANGTDALEVLLRAGGVGPGDEVIVPAVSWIATSEAVTNVGGLPVFADVSRDSHTIDPESIESRLTAKTKAVIPVHLYGCPADMDPIMKIARERNLFVLEDCAQAHGAEYRGKKVGTIGNAGSFSFFPGKNLGAYGDAGGMVTNDSTIASVARMICQHGQSDRKFQHEIEGRNSRMDGIQAAILSVKLKYLPEWTDRRINAAAQYACLLTDLPVHLPRSPDVLRHVFHLYAILVDDRDSVRELLGARGIPTGVQYPVPLPFLAAYGDRGCVPSEFPRASALCNRVLTLPIFGEISAEQVNHVGKCVRECVQAHDIPE